MEYTMPERLGNQPHHTPEEKATLALVLDFYREYVLGCDFSREAEFCGPTYQQHTPSIRDGVDGLREFALGIRDRFPQAKLDFLRAFVDGDFVITHSRATLTPGMPQESVIDMFRVENGKVVEHWDIIQQVPAESANTNTMF